MNVLHAVRSNGFAGVERHVAELARAQAAAGDDVVVVGGDPQAMRAALAGDTAAARIPHHPAATVLAVARALAALGPGCDVVHVHMTAAEVAATLAAAARPALRRVPVVSTRHFAGTRGSGPVGALTARVARHRVADQVAISAYVAEHVDGPATVVHPGVRESAGPVADAAGREPVVLVAQRHEPEKGTDVAVRAFAASGLADAGWRLELAGSGTLTPALQALAGELGIAAAATFLGRRDDVPALMARAAVLVAPCAVEGLGLSVVEAMAAGLPALVADAGGHRETVGALGVPGALFPPGDAATAGARLAALARDPRLRDTLARAGLDLQRASFTPQAHAAGVRAVYDRVVAASARVAQGVRR